MFSDIAGVRTALKDRLTPLLPEGWTIEPNLKQPPTEYRSPMATLFFTRFDPSVDGDRLGAGFAAAGVDVILGSPMSTEAGEDDVDQLALTLIQVIDTQSDIYWTTAEKDRLPAGQWIWTIHTIVLTESKEQ